MDETLTLSFTIQTTYQAVIDVIRSAEGISGLYSGLNSSLLGISKGRSSLLAARSSPGSKGLSTVESLLNGFIAGSATSIISNPIWVIQTQQAVRTMVPSSNDPNAPEKVAVIKKLSFMETAMNIINKSGVGALWSGIGPALILVINPIIQYTVFEQLKNSIMQRRTAKLRAAGSPRAASMSDLDYFILGALSKLGSSSSLLRPKHCASNTAIRLVATSLTYPYIVVKSRLQAGSAQYTSAWAGLQAILGNEGVAGLYKGISTKLIQSVLTAAILFAGQKRVYEVTKRVLTGAGLAKI
ncbi:10151_t:CDS:2 [Acaulospora colombiana]|uniref:10151_t:CDS:1 n=1 Tax=Acaulospora colombiana TaxID=27376 RepID=A0ACA9N347_9GLOM|nr:10151_t:CDS:2 [Acaulospora colombiana]